MSILRPDYAEVHEDLGTAFVAQGKLDEAIMYYQWALAPQSGDAKAHVDLGRAFLMQGMLDQMMASYQRAVALQPDNACGAPDSQNTLAISAFAHFCDARFANSAPLEREKIVLSPTERGDDRAGQPCHDSSRNRLYALRLHEQSSSAPCY